MMRYKSIELTNYIGIANGLGLHKIYIDFTKCKHRIVVIRGDNGSGKSTLFNALHVLPDPSDMFIPGMDATKVIEVMDEEIGASYIIRYEHTWKNKSFTTKGFITKTFDGISTNMNPQGTITACRDIIFNEFNLDSNFMALSQLSHDDKGLASKTPAERKKFVASILASTEAYQNIYKTISKRSSVFKSMINATTSKIERLGDEKLLTSSLTSIQARISSITDRRNMELENLGSQKSIIGQLDATGSIRESYDIISNMVSELSNNKTITERQISALISELGITKIDQSVLDDIHDAKLKTQFDITQIESSIEILTTRREEETIQLQSKISRLNALQSETNYLTTKTMVDTCRSKLDEYEDFFKSMGLRDYSLTHDEYVIGLNTLKDIKDTVDVFKDSVSFEDMNIALTQYVMTNSYPDRDTLADSISGLEQYLTECRNQLVYYNAQLKISTKLSLRHPECRLDECEFIKDAVLAASENPVENIERLESEIYSTEDIVNRQTKELEKVSSIIMAINYFKVLFRNIESYASILRKLPNGDIFSDKDKFIKNLLNGSTFDEINDIYPYITQASIVEDYGKTVKLMESLKADVKIYESKNSLILEIQSDIQKVNDDINALSDNIIDSGNTLFKLKQDLDLYTYKESTIKTLLELYSSRERLNLDILENQNNLRAIESSISSIQNAIMQIEAINQRLGQINSELSTLDKDKNDIEHSIRLLKEYKDEMGEYLAKYEKIEAIKFFSSYNTGIQTTFMELYMHQVNKVANTLMGYVLGGRYHFKKWVINEQEFRIPCLGDGGYLNDDISSLSGGQSAIVSMIISFSLLYQASTKYNVLKLDEVDATLDYANRAQFLNALEQLMDILKCRQLFMISHNDEINLDNSDIIVLKFDDNAKYNDVISIGNVIYNYREVV